MFTLKIYAAISIIEIRVPILTIKVTEDIKIIIKEPTSIEFSYKKSTSFSDIDETIIREAKLNILIFEDDLFEIYNKSKSSGKKRKRDVNIYEYNPSVSAA